MFSNLAFVTLIAAGFVFLPRPLMLAVAVVSVFLPTIVVVVVRWVVVVVPWTIALLKFVLDTSLLVGPWTVEMVMTLAGYFIGLSATSPAAAVLVIWLVAFFSSKMFQRVTLHLGLDLNNDGKVGWRDLWVWLVSTITERSGPKTRETLALDELKAGAKKKLRAAKQTEEILERMERLEAMLLHLGAPDLRAQQQAVAAADHTDADSLLGERAPLTRGAPSAPVASGAEDVAA